MSENRDLNSETASQAGVSGRVAPMLQKFFRFRVLTTPRNDAIGRGTSERHTNERRERMMKTYKLTNSGVMIVVSRKCSSVIVDDVEMRISRADAAKLLSVARRNDNVRKI